MPTLPDNPFAVLTAVVAPAILTNASSVLCLGTANRIARVVDRTRVVTAEIKAAAAGAAEYDGQMREMAWLRVRAKLLLRALRLFYASIGAFVAAALISVIGSALAAFDFRVAFQTAAAIGLVDLIDLVAFHNLLNLFETLRTERGSDHSHRGGALSGVHIQ